MNKRLITLAAVLGLWIGAEAKEYTFGTTETEGLKELLRSGTLRLGDCVTLAPGEYRDLGDIAFTGHGTAADTITLRSAAPGSVTIAGDMRMRLWGEFLKVEGLAFVGAWNRGGSLIEFRDKDTGEVASHCRLTNCVIDGCNDPKKSTSGKVPEGKKADSEYWLNLFGTNNRIDHCYLANKTVGGLVLQLWLSQESHLNNHMVDHNVFGPRPQYDANGAEIIRIGHSWSSQLKSHAIVEDNVFLHCDGENEIISVKSCNNVLRRNLFLESRGGLVCRHGHYNVIEDNTFVGNHIKGTCGIRIINQGHTVYRNLMSRIDDFCLLVRMAVYERPTAETDTKAEPLTSYHRVENVDIAYNIISDCRDINLCSGYGELSPRNVRMANNTISGSASNFHMRDPEKNLPGFFFTGNRYHFADNAIIPYPGFDKMPSPADFSTEERERVMQAVAGVGTPWYKPSVDNLDYIVSKYN